MQASRFVPYLLSILTLAAALQSPPVSAQWPAPVPTPDSGQAGVVLHGSAARPAAPPVGVREAIVAMPGRVGRVAGVVGAAQLWDAQDRHWAPLPLNRLISTGDRIRSEAEARVEISIGGLELFVGPHSEVDIVRLDAQGAQMRLHQGHLVARVRSAEWARDLTLETAEFSAQASVPGLYRLDRDTVSGGRSAAAALRGLLMLGAVDARLQVAAGQRIEVMGQSAGGGLRSTTMLNDGFGAWVSARDQTPEPAAFAGVAALGEMTGLEALERHGRWESHPDWGWVWYPVAVRPGWEPFRDGRWVWVRPWGWTWVDDAPWGFAPSHYGRWLQWNNRWVWSPAPVRGRPISPVVPPAAPPVGAAPNLRPRDELLPGQWPGDHENRLVRTPRIDSGNHGLGRPVPASVPAPGGVIQPSGNDERAGRAGRPDRSDRPDRRHGFDRPERAESARPKQPAERERERSDKPEKPDRQRQQAQ